jgi:AraC-like DNA-binding protein
LVPWVLDNLGEELNVGVLAEHVSMSPRNFARVFTKEMKTTPAVFIERLRVESVRRRSRGEPAQPEEDRHREWVPKRELDARGFPATIGNCAGTVSAKVSR